MKNLSFLLIALTFSTTSLAADKAQEREKLVAEGKSLIKTFASKLKPKLKQTIQSEGPAAAIKVCSEFAPKIAKELSAESGWDIKRVSLKPRNKNSAVADNWEQSHLEAFDKGTDRNAAILHDDNQFRMMKAQRVEAVCLLCHGTSISDEVKSALEEYYPEDKATGYQLGDVRGAFSLSKKLK